MSNELTIPEFLSPANIKDDLDAQSGLITNPASLYPSLKMNKDMRGFVLSLGEQVIDRPDEVMFVILGDENFYGSRALFPPGNSEDTTPVCATRLLSPRNKEGWIGKWNDASGYPNPSDGKHICGKCPWSAFGSAPRWDATKSGGGPACKERRAIYGVRVEETSKRGQYHMTDDTVIRMVLPATSIRTTQEMVSKATAGGVPLSAAVFILTNKIEAKGSIKWSVLKAELVGVIGTKESWAKIQELRPKVHSVVSGDKALDGSSYMDTTVKTEAEPDDGIPF